MSRDVVIIIPDCRRLSNFARNEMLKKLDLAESNFVEKKLISRERNDTNEDLGISYSSRIWQKKLAKSQNFTPLS